MAGDPVLETGGDTDGAFVSAACAASRAPLSVVDRIRYEYPSYTGYETREVENTGDIRAVEGTIVKISAVSNKMAFSEMLARRECILVFMTAPLSVATAEP